MIQPYELLITNDPGEPVTIKLDVNNKIDGPTYYEIDFNGEPMFLTLETLEELVKAARQLYKTTRSYKLEKNT